MRKNQRMTEAKKRHRANMESFQACLCHTLRIHFASPKRDRELERRRDQNWPPSGAAPVAGGVLRLAEARA